MNVIIGALITFLVVILVLYLVNMLVMRNNGRGPKEKLTLGQALAGYPNDPAIGKILWSDVDRSGIHEARK